MQQMLHWRSDAKILASAFSNSTAALIDSHLASHLDPKQLSRFYALSWSEADEFQDYVYADQNGAFSIPSDTSLKEDLSAFRVIVTTCQSGSIAHGKGLPRGLFTHISIDEAEDSGAYTN